MASFKATKLCSLLSQTSRIASQCHYPTCVTIGSTHNGLLSRRISTTPVHNHLPSDKLSENENRSRWVMRTESTTLKERLLDGTYENLNLTILWIIIGGYTILYFNEMFPRVRVEDLKKEALSRKY